MKQLLTAKRLPNTDYINTAGFLVSDNYFSLYNVTNQLSTEHACGPLKTHRRVVG
jgi:hypothetical protein